MRDNYTTDRTVSDDQGLSVGAPSGVAVRTLAREVVLRLSRGISVSALELAADVEAEEVARLCDALIGPDTERATAIAREGLEAGLSFDDLCERRLAPAARRLGELWEADELSFADVTLAANRLFGILRALAHRPIPRADARFAAFASVPGEEHVLGVTMAAERARGAGWDVVLLLGLGHEDLVRRITDVAPEVIGLSLSSRRVLLPLTRLVVALRIAVPASPIVVCGPGVAEVGEPIVGVDCMVKDFDGAMAALSRLTD